MGRVILVMNKYLVMRNKLGEMIRIFHWNTDQAFVVYRKDLGRLELCTNLQDFDPDSISVIKQLRENSLKSSYTTKIGHTFQLVHHLDNEKTHSWLDYTKSVNSRFANSNRILLSVFSAGLCFSISIFLAFKNTTNDLDRTLQFLGPVQIVQRSKIPIHPEKVITESRQVMARMTTVRKQPKAPPKKSLRKLGALATLGQSSVQDKMSGLNLGTKKVTRGPGIQAESLRTPASGGIQQTIYSKGIIRMAIGEGNNLQGGGGYGIKGRNRSGGKPSYGRIGIIGSQGLSDISETGMQNLQGGSFDPNLIVERISRKAGLIRQCYDEVLKRIQT